MVSQATIAGTRGEVEQALHTLQEALSLMVAQEQFGLQAAVWTIAGTIVAGSGRFEQAVSLYAAADVVQHDVDSIIETHVAEERDAMLQRAGQQLSRTDFRTAWERGKSMRSEGMLAVAAMPPSSERASPARQATGHDQVLQSLSSREREVLQLLAEGLSDQQIADQLFLSKRTVSTHVASIRAKLGVDSRTAAAGVAIRSGLA
jgi:DNA-binding NarL/FixJ family response regulator